MAQVGGGPGGPALVPTGQYVTPKAAPGSRVLQLNNGLRPDGNADPTIGVATALSPDGTTLLVMTSGYNTFFNDESGDPFLYNVLDPRTGMPSSVTTPNAEWIFVYDVRGQVPRKIQ